MVKRVVVINDASTARGGATGLALLSVRLLRGLGVPVTFIAGDDGANPEFAALNVDVVALGGQHIAKGSPAQAAINGIYNIASERMIARWIEENDAPGVVYHVHGWSKILSPAIFRALRPVAARTVLHAHDFFLACPNGGFYDYRKSRPCPLIPLSADCIASSCDKRSYSQKVWRVLRQKTLSMLSDQHFRETPIAMIHEGMADYFRRAGIHPSRLRVLRNPVERFSDERVQVERNSLFYFIGRIENEKGVWDAAAACRKAGARLRMIGDGPERARLSAAYPETDIQGWSSRQRLGELVQEARAVLMPSHYPEPFGLVAAEASRSGIPVILSETALLGPEFTRHNLGISCDTRNIDDFAAAIRQLVAMDERDIQDMSQRGFRAEAPLASSPAVWRDGLMDLYEERVGNRGQGAAAKIQAGSDAGTAVRPSIRLFNVKYSPNLGDGLLSEALEHALHELGAAEEETVSVDLAARTAYGAGGTARSFVLKALSAFPDDLRQRAIRIPLHLMLRQKWLPHYEAKLGAADAVVIGGGNLLTDMDLNFPVKIAAVLKLAGARNVPVAIYGVGVSGDWSAEGLRLMRDALRKARPCYVSVRDRASQENFDRLFSEAAGTRAKLVRDPGLLVSRYVEPGSGGNTVPRVGICITSAIAVRYHSDVQISDADLETWYARLCGALTGRGYVVDVFTNGSPEDEEFLDGLFSRLADASGERIHRKRLNVPAELAVFASGLDLLIAHRMHALIAAYSYGVPIFALRWDRKVDAFMESVGRSDCIASTDLGILDGVVTKVDNLLDRSSQNRQENVGVVEEAFADARGLYQALVATSGTHRGAASPTEPLETVSEVSRP